MTAINWLTFAIVNLKRYWLVDRSVHNMYVTTLVYTRAQMCLDYKYIHITC